MRLKPESGVKIPIASTADETQRSAGGCLEMQPGEGSLRAGEASGARRAAPRVPASRGVGGGDVAELPAETPGARNTA